MAALHANVAGYAATSKPLVLRSSPPTGENLLNERYGGYGAFKDLRRHYSTTHMASGQGNTTPHRLSPHCVPDT